MIYSNQKIQLFMGENNMNLTHILGIATTATSLGTMAASIANILK